MKYRYLVPILAGLLFFVVLYGGYRHLLNNAVNVWWHDEGHVKSDQIIQALDYMQVDTTEIKGLCQHEDMTASMADACLDAEEKAVKDLEDAAH